MLKFESWSQEDAEKEIPKRLKSALEHRSQWEAEWRTNELILFGDGRLGDDQITRSYNALAEVLGGDVDVGDSWLTINYAFKYLRFIHSQMAANPPSVMPIPTSADYNDRRAADVADSIVNHIRRRYLAQEQVDLTTLQVGIYGTGFTKACYDPNAGDILEVDRQAKTLVMSGDLRIRPALIWDIAIDHTARCWADVRYVFERHILSEEEACHRWPAHKDEFKNAATKDAKASAAWADGDSKAQGRVVVWEYTERGLPWNGMAGRRCFLLSSGKLLSDLAPNPTPDAALPYYPLTDIDIPGQVYGRSFVSYLVRLQDVLNRLDSTCLDQIQAHGVVRMVVYDAAEEQDGLPSDSTWQVANIKGAGGQKPDFINPPTLMPDIYKFREQLLAGMSELAGVNDSMFGQVKREMSGFSMQTSINAGNMVRRRLYNKYEAYVEALYKGALRLVQEHWTDKQKILVTGKEGALSVAYYSGADITDGFDLDVRYGASFSLDPTSRREEIMQLMPFLKEAGYSMKVILGMLKLNDIAGLFDLTTQAQRRQLEIFDEMISKFEATGTLVYIKPEDGEKHDDMLSACYDFRMSMAYKCLDPQVKELVKAHIRDREQLMAQEAAPAPGAAGPAPGAPPAGAPGMPPVGGLPGLG
jgi:hypothetical protein